MEAPHRKARLPNGTEHTHVCSPKGNGAKANGKLVQHRFPHNITNILFDAGRGPALMSYEFDSVDVNAFYEAVQHDREGRLKTVGAAWGGEHSHADPMVYDTYTHEDEPGDEVVFVVPDSGNPHFGCTKKRPEPEPELPEPEPATEEEVQAVLKDMPEASRDEAEHIAEVRHNTPPEVLAALERAEQTHDVFPKRRYEPMKSGVWVGAGVNEDDVRALHPDPVLDKVYEEKVDASKDPQAFYDKVHGDRLSFEPNPTLEAKVDRLTTAIETLVDLLQKK